MNREKYLSNEDYREGYTDGVKEAKKTVYLNALRRLVPKVNDLNILIAEFEKEYKGKNLMEVGA